MQQAVEIQSHGLTLRGMIHIPDARPEKVPMVLIFHGFTAHKMETHFMFVKLSRRLEQAGIASVRWDFGGSGESDGNFVDMTVSGELAEAENILDYVKKLDFVDNAKIGAVGMSMGGAVASMLAGKRSEDLRTLCLWAPAANIREVYQRGKTDADLLAMAMNGSMDIGGLQLGYRFAKDIATLDIYKKAAPYGRNVFILHGDNDMTVPLSVSERYLKIYGDRATLHMIEGANHPFSKQEWEDELLGETVRFLQKELL